MSKISKILVGTHNLGKFKEISYLISKKIKKISPQSLKIKSPKETGKTFRKNAEIKANYFYKHSRLVTISDDSGLEVSALKNKPGIYSSRWADKLGGFKKAKQKILKLLINKKNRKAKFVCSLAIKFKNKKMISVVGEKEGFISMRDKGSNGFGYDSIFIPKGGNKTFGQIPKKKKMKIDHRFKAFQKLKKKIRIL
tara:strand:+ start:120 stop:707 length:588 start_codon:yes stop_codon:yes gene_type:complete